MATDTWDPQQYDRFREQRRQPFDDLVRLVIPIPGGRAVDLGCGPGGLTAELHRGIRAAETVGIDSSAAMLAQAAAHAGGGLRFELGDLSTYAGRGLDLVFANASLQWVPDHPALVTRLRQALGPNGQLAFQVPANWDHPSHLLAIEIAGESPFLEAFGGAPPLDHTRSVLPPETYAELLDRLGAAEQHVRLQIYGHHLESAEMVVEWVKGTMLTSFRAALPPALFEVYLDRYTTRLVERLGTARPYFYAYKRILCWARFP